MARPPVMEPDTVEYRTALSILGRKTQAVQLVRMYPEADWKEIMLKAKDWKEGIHAAKLERKTGAVMGSASLTPKGWQKFFWSARLLTLCGMPHTADPKITRAVRQIPLGAGNVGTVTFNATKPGVTLPFGMNDRTAFECLCSLAVIQKSRMIELDSLADFYRMMNPGVLKVIGSPYESMKASLRRLSYCAMMIDVGDGMTNYSRVQGMIGATYLPSEEFSRGEVPLEFDELTLTRSGGKRFRVLLDEGLYHVLTTEGMPFPVEYMQGFMGKDDTLAWDLAKYLPSRLHAAKTESRIWFNSYNNDGISLKDQLGVTDTNPTRVSEKFMEAIRRVQSVWGGAAKGVEVTPFYMTVHPIDRKDWLVPPRDTEVLSGDSMDELDTASTGSQLLEL